MSIGSNLVRGDTNRSVDVFVKDRATGKTTRVSVSSRGRQGNAGSGDPAISADGRFIAFTSQASNLVTGDTNRCMDLYKTSGNLCPDVFVHDQLTHTTVRVSLSSAGRQSNGASDRGVSISADGRYIAFGSAATNLVSGDTNRRADVFVRDRRTGTTERVSITDDGRQANHDSTDPRISWDGSRILFISPASNLDARGATSCRSNSAVYPCPNVFMRDVKSRETLTIVRTSVGTSFATISGNGRFVAFTSAAQNLVPGDTNEKEDVFVYDVSNARTTRASVSSSEEEGHDGIRGMPAISPDGRYVAFSSESSNLVAGDDHECEYSITGERYSCWDILLRDRVEGTTELVSITSSGEQVDGNSFDPVLSSNADHVVFTAQASNISGPPPSSCSAEAHCSHIYVRDRFAETTRAISTASPKTKTTTDGDGGSGDPSISGDGGVVAFYSVASNFVRNDNNGHADIIIWRRGGGYSRASISSSGREANGPSDSPSISSNGRVVAFVSNATNLVPGDTNDHQDIFVRDMAAHRTSRVSIATSGSEANGPSGMPALSADGRYVIFSSEASNLVSDDTNGDSDVFVHDRSTGRTTRVSVSTYGAQGNGASQAGTISADGRRIAFNSEASNLVAEDSEDCPRREPAGSCWDVFIRDLTTGMTTLVSVTNDGAVANSDSYSPLISGDGRSVVFVSFANDLAGGRGSDNYGNPVYVRNLETKVTRQIGEADEDIPIVNLSFDGRYVAPVQWDGKMSIFDRSAETYIPVTNCAPRGPGDLDAAGRYFVWGWICSEDGDRNGHNDIYMFDRRTRSITWISKPIR
jgi:Tol biopolymer transport system component